MLKSFTVTERNCIRTRCSAKELPLSSMDTSGQESESRWVRGLICPQRLTAGQGKRSWLIAEAPRTFEAPRVPRSPLIQHLLRGHATLHAAPAQQRAPHWGIIPPLKFIHILKEFQREPYGRFALCRRPALPKLYEFYQTAI